LFLEAPLFSPPIHTPKSDQTDSLPSNNEINTPEKMANLFGVPYLGKLPMDPNMMYSCENGFSFLDQFPNSPATKPFSSIIDKVIDVTKNEISKSGE
jgi:Flp pilus assembly CpaE family ATPase